MLESQTESVNLLLGSLDENFECDASKSLPAEQIKVWHLQLINITFSVDRQVARAIFYEGNCMTANDFRRAALSLPEAVEGSHFGQADFRVGGKIFATLSLVAEGYGVLMLTPEQQAGMVEDEPNIFSPVPKEWGRMGATRVLLAKVPPDILKSALRTAWMRRAPKRLLRSNNSEL
jgi:hypothetical protein